MQLLVRANTISNPRLLEFLVLSLEHRSVNASLLNPLLVLEPMVIPFVPSQHIPSEENLALLVEWATQGKATIKLTMLLGQAIMIIPVHSIRIRE